MARRYINTSKFNPYSYQEMAVPLEKATAVLSQQVQNLSTVEMQNMALGQYLDPETDAEQIKIYKQNMANLRAASDHLLQYGMRGDIYGVMKNANIAYFKDIQPMQNAVTNRLQYYAKRNEVQSANPDVVVKGDLKKPLSEFYGTMPKMELISGKAIQADVSAVLTAINRGLSSVDKRDYDKYNDVVTQLTGYSIEDYQKQMEDPESNIQKIMHDVMRKYGAEDENRNPLVSLPDYNKLWSYAETGSYAAIGSKTESLKDNNYFQIASNNRAQAEFDIKRKQEDLQLMLTANEIANSTGADPKEVYETLKNPSIEKLSKFNSGSKNNVYIPKNSFNVNPQPNDMDNKISDGSEKFKRSHILNLATDIDKYKPDKNSDGTWNWNDLTKWRPFKGKTGDAIGKGVAEHVFALCNVKDYKHMTDTEVQRVYDKCKELGYKASHVSPVYRVTFTGSTAKNLLWMMRSHFIGNPELSDKDIDATLSVDMVLDTKDANVIRYETENGNFATTATEMINVFSNENEIKTSYENLSALTTSKSNSYSNLFWHSTPTVFNEVTGKVETEAMAAFDATITYIKDNLKEKKSS